MHFIIYETTNKINGKKYRGAHITNDINDAYLGSGKLLKKAIARYGIDSFERTILCECSSVKEMFLLEAEYVNAAWVEDPNTYNLKIGGEGGWDFINKNGIRWTEEKRRLHSIEMKKKRASGEWGPKCPKSGFQGKTHSIEVRKRISEASKLPQDVIDSRLSDWNSIPDVRGKISKVSKMWGVSHTQVKRFINRYLGVA